MTKLNIAHFLIWISGSLFGAGLSMSFRDYSERNHDIEINQLTADYEKKLATKELQVTITQSSYAECNKRYKQPRPIVCD